MSHTLPNPFPGMETITTTTITRKKSDFKPVNAGKKKSHVVFILDDSGSMSPNRDTTISGFNEFLLSQATDARRDGIPTKASLYKFDGYSVKSVFKKTKIDQVAPLNKYTYDPRGGTNLLDAMGTVMKEINADLKLSKKRDRESIIICILTDGEENMSKTFNNEKIKAMVELAEGKNWSFMFLGANIDAFAVGSQWGFRQENTIQYDTHNMHETIMNASASTSRMKSARSMGLSSEQTYATSAFTSDERKSSFGE